MKSIITGSEWLYYQGDCQHNAVEISAEKQFHDAVGGRSYFSFEQIHCSEENEDCPYWRDCPTIQKALNKWRS